MIKKLNTWLLRNHPLLWNTKAVWAGTGIILLHCLFYFSGRFSFQSLEKINRGYSYYNYQNHNEVFSIFLLVVVLFLLVWLLTYFLNNAFKSFYPVSRLYLFKEFIVCFVICFGACTLYSAYDRGFNDAILKYTVGFDLEKDVAKLNQAACFLPFNANDFEKRECCDSIDARNFNVAMQNDVPDYGEGSPCDIEQEYTEAVEPPSTTAPVATYTPSYSYLYYCTSRFYTSNQQAGRTHIHLAHKWLRQGNKTAILNSINDFKALCKKYEVYDNIDAAFFTNACFADSAYTVQYDIVEHTYEYEEVDSPGDGLKSTQYKANVEDLVACINMIEHARSRKYLGTDVFFLELFFALGIALFIFSFRITSLKAWLISIVGGIVWIILLGMSAVNSFGHNQIPTLVIILSLLFLILAIVLIRAKQTHTLAGIVFIWFMASMGFVFPFMMQIIYDHTHEVRECIDHVLTVTYREPDIHTWIQANWATIAYINAGLVIALVAFVIIPLSYKWQSNPEE
ncbi:MAG TPA: hypothetical protein VK177_08615 [Flavobacteriales bacterium]|nr:hypothetical protein [Flavobacteriales bacterium]